MSRDDQTMTTNGADKSSCRSLSFSARYRQRRGGMTMSLNLTPMIDIVFLLLFFFLMVSRFQVSEGMLPAKLPSQAAAVAVDIPRTPIRIRLATGGSTEVCRVTIDRFNPAPMPLAELADRLRQIRDDVPGFDRDTPIVLVAGDDVAWDHVVNGYNAAVAAEFGKIFFSSPKPERGGR